MPRPETTIDAGSDPPTGQLHREISEQPHALRSALQGRLKASEGKIDLKNFEPHLPLLEQASKLTLVACGSSWHAALIGEYLLEGLARIPVEVEYASEFCYRNPVIHKNDVVIVVSQSGTTADTIGAIDHAQRQGAVVYGIYNQENSPIGEQVNAGLCTFSGAEGGLMSTKAFTNQVAVFILLALRLADVKRTLNTSMFQHYLFELESMPQQIQRTLTLEESIQQLARFYTFAQNFLYLGRGINYPLALEGALKLKELAHIHAEGYPAAEMKHGLIALIDKKMPVVALATNSTLREKILSNMMEIKSRNGHIIAIVQGNNEQVTQLADHTITLPNCSELFSPLLNAVPLQLLAYHIAVMKGCNTDLPRQQDLSPV